MTWVVGAGTVDFGVLVGDIRVSYDDGDRGYEELRFGVRKIHQVTPSIWAGFAGSVELGFRMVRRLRAFARAEYERTRTPPEPDVLINDFAAREESRYPKFAEDLRWGGCELLVVGARQRWVELNGKQVFRMALGTIVRFPLPGEIGVEASPIDFNHFGSIGSGSGIEEFRLHLEESVSDGRQGLLACSPTAHAVFSDVLPLAGYITSLGLGSVVEQTPVLGISSQMYVAVVTPTGTFLGSNGGAELRLGDGAKRAVPPFPPIAESLEELQRLFKRFASEPSGVAIC